MSQASTYQCPNCSGVLSYDAASGLLVCKFCESAFHEGEVEKDLPLNSEPVEARETEHVKTVDEFLQHAPWEATQNAIGYSCPSCGAGVVADQSAVTASCPYCGNNMVVSGIATESNVPEWVLPFSVTREQAEAEMRRHFEHKWYLSRKFSASLEHMQGVYVPYYLYDMRLSGYADYIAYHEDPDEEHSSKTYQAMHRAGHALFEKIPVDGSSKMPDAHMDAIAPFHFDRLRGFSTSYVAGYLTEVPDESLEECLPRADARARNSFTSDLKNDAMCARGVTGIDEVVAQETAVNLEGVASCVLPVWLAHCTWNDVQMLFAVNGETGKCVGDLPIDGKRRAVTVIVAVLVMILITALVTLIEFNAKDAANARGVAIGGLIFTVLIPLVVDAYFKKQMHTAVEATDAKMSYSSEGLVVTERWENGKFYMRKSKAMKKLEEYRTQ